jgi:hypothetical protein
VTFLATAVADVAGRWRLIRDSRLLREERSVVDSLTSIMLVYRKKVVWWSLTYAAISAESAAQDALFSLNIACSFSSSVMGLPLEAALIAAGAALLESVRVASTRCWFLALTGIFPETYRAALPAPGFVAGRRRAITVVERGI